MPIPWGNFNNQKPGEEETAVLKRMFPEKIVVSIPHGFFTPGFLDESRLESGAIATVGSNTTWGEMRHIDDALHLMQALHESRPDQKVLGFIAGKFDRHVDLNSYRNRPDIWFLENQEISGASHRGEFTDFASYRGWLHRKAAGRTILRPTEYNGVQSISGAIKKWEQELVDFNVQAYREILKNNEPKVEASGTLHMSGGPAIGVVIDSPAMRDIVRDEGLEMVLMPYENGAINYRAAADQVLRLINHPAERRDIIRHNIEIATTLGMEEIAFAYRLVAEALLLASQLKPAGKLIENIQRLARKPGGLIAGVGLPDVHGRVFKPDSRFFTADGGFTDEMKKFMDSLSDPDVQKQIEAGIMYYDIRSKFWREHPGFSVVFAMAYARMLQRKFKQQDGHIINFGLDAYENHFNVAQVVADTLFRMGITDHGGGVNYWGCINGGAVRNYSQLYQAVNGKGGNWLYFTMSHVADDFSGAKLGMDTEVFCGPQLRHVGDVQSGTFYDEVIEMGREWAADREKFLSMFKHHESKGVVVTVDERSMIQNQIQVAADLIRTTCAHRSEQELPNHKVLAGTKFYVPVWGNPLYLQLARLLRGLGADVMVDSEALDLDFNRANIIDPNEHHSPKVLEMKQMALRFWREDREEPRIAVYADPDSDRTGVAAGFKGTSVISDGEAMSLPGAVFSLLAAEQLTQSMDKVTVISDMRTGVSIIDLQEALKDRGLHLNVIPHEAGYPFFMKGMSEHNATIAIENTSHAFMRPMTDLNWGAPKEYRRPDGKAYQGGDDAALFLAYLAGAMRYAWEMRNPAQQLEYVQKKYHLKSAVVDERKPRMPVEDDLWKYRIADRMKILAHQWLDDKTDDFAINFGDPKVELVSGVHVTNKRTGAMVLTRYSNTGPSYTISGEGYTREELDEMLSLGRLLMVTAVDQLHAEQRARGEKEFGFDEKDAANLAGKFDPARYGIDTHKQEQRDGGSILQAPDLERMNRNQSLKEFLVRLLDKRYTHFSLRPGLATAILDTLWKHAKNPEEARRQVEENVINFTTDPSWIAAYGRYKKQTKYETTYAQIKDQLAQLRAGSLVVDVGCGGNDLGGQIAKAHPDLRVIGTDIDDRYAPIGLPNLTFLKQKTALSLPDELEAGAVDVITLNAVAHHIQSHDLDKLLSEIRRVLKPSGQVILIEDTYSLSENLSPELDSDVELTREFLDGVRNQGIAFALDFFAFNDWYTNIFVHHWDSMPMAYNFHSMEDWTEIFQHHGFSLIGEATKHFGFPAETFHKVDTGVLVFTMVPTPAQLYKREGATDSAPATVPHEAAVFKLAERIREVGFKHDPEGWGHMTFAEDGETRSPRFGPTMEAALTSIDRFRRRHFGTNPEDFKDPVIVSGSGIGGQMTCSIPALGFIVRFLNRMMVVCDSLGINYHPLEDAWVKALQDNPNTILLWVVDTKSGVTDETMVNFQMNLKTMIRVWARHLETQKDRKHGDEKGREIARTLIAKLFDGKSIFDKKLSNLSLTDEEKLILRIVFKNLIVVTGPKETGSRLAKLVEESFLNDLYADPEDRVVTILMLGNLGGRFQSLSPSSFVYDALLGIDVRAMLEAAKQFVAEERGQDMPRSKQVASELYQRDIHHLLISMPNDIIFDRVSEMLGQVVPESTGKGRILGIPMGIQTYASSAENINNALRTVDYKGQKAYLALDVKGQPKTHVNPEIENNNLIIRYELESISEPELAKLTQFMENVTAYYGTLNVAKALLEFQKKEPALQAVPLNENTSEEILAKIMNGPKGGDANYDELLRLHNIFNDITPFRQPNVEFAKRIVQPDKRTGRGGYGMLKFNSREQYDADGLPVRSETERFQAYQYDNEEASRGPVLDLNSLGLRNRARQYQVGRIAKLILRRTLQGIKVPSRRIASEAVTQFIVEHLDKLEDLQSKIATAGVPARTYAEMQELQHQRNDLLNQIQRYARLSPVTETIEATARQLAALLLKAHKSGKSLNFSLYEDRNNVSEILKRFADLLGGDRFDFCTAEQHRSYEIRSGGVDTGIDVLIQSVKDLTWVRQSEEKVIYDGLVPEYLHGLFPSEIGATYLQAYSDRFRHAEVQTETAVLKSKDLTLKPNIAEMMIVLTRMMEIYGAMRVPQAPMPTYHTRGKVRAFLSWLGLNNPPSWLVELLAGVYAPFSPYETRLKLTNPKRFAQEHPHPWRAAVGLAFNYLGVATGMIGAPLLLAHSPAGAALSVAGGAVTGLVGTHLAINASYLAIAWAWRGLRRSLPRAARVYCTAA